MSKGTIGISLILVATIAISGGIFSLESYRIAALTQFDKLLAQVGVAVGVAPNPYNTLDDQLNQKQMQIDEEQADLATREAEFASSTATDTVASASPVVWYLTTAVGVLAFLVGLNFYLDWRRSEKEAALLQAQENAASGGVLPPQA